MSDWALRGGNVVEWLGGILASSFGPLATAGASADTKGSYAEILASTARPYSGMLITILGAGAVKDHLVDIAFGAAGLEVDIVSNFLISGGRTFMSYVDFPIGVPPSTRVSYRQQCSTASIQTAITIGFVVPDFIASSHYGGVDTLGANTGDSGGTGIDPGGTIHTKGSYAEIIASTSRPYKALGISIGTRNNAQTQTSNFLMDLAIGSAGSEQDILTNIELRGSSASGSDEIRPSFLGPQLPIYIPSGSRIAGRGQCNITNLPDRLFDMVLYGLY